MEDPVFTLDGPSALAPGEIGIWDFNMTFSWQVDDVKVSILVDVAQSKHVVVNMAFLHHIGRL